LYIHAEFDFSLSVSSILARPFYNDHTIYGAVLCFFIPYLIYLTYEQRKSIALFGVLALTVLVFIGFFFSYSRAAWLSLALAGVFYVFMQIRHKLILTFGLLVLIGIAIFFSWESISTAAIGSTAISNKENISEHVQSVANINSDVSNAERINRWKCALRMFADKPLMGFGPGTYQFYYGSYQIRSDMTRISTYQGDRGHAHSEYLNRLSEIGWPGLLLFMATAFFVFLSAWRIEQSTTSPIVRNLTRVNILALFTFYIHGFFNGFSDTDKMAMPVYAAMAVIVVLDIKNQKTDRQQVIS
jgi:O-antigen ligase